jgi:LysM repeat protein
MKFIFIKDEEELALPVTPESFSVSHGINIETINIHTLGDVAVAGYGTLPTFKVSCMFPAQAYPFNEATADINDPYGYVRKFENWCDNRSVLRWIITDTTVNCLVLINDISYGEQDGTGDVYAALTLRKYRQLSVVRTEKTGNLSRQAEAAAVISETYVVSKGDTLSAIARKYYGDTSFTSKLASYNGIPNTSLIKPGQIIKLPGKKQFAAIVRAE